MKQRHPLITPEELEQLAEIDRLLDEANAHMYKIGMYGKSSEGHLEVSFGTHDDRFPDRERYTPQVSIYAYMLGPHRRHDFDSPQQALDVVRVWHHNALLETSEDDWDWDEDETTNHEPGRDLKGIDLFRGPSSSGRLPDPYLDIEREREREMNELMDRYREKVYGDNAT